MEPLAHYRVAPEQSLLTAGADARGSGPDSGAGAHASTSYPCRARHRDRKPWQAVAATWLGHVSPTQYVRQVPSSAGVRIAISRHSFSETPE